MKGACTQSALEVGSTERNFLHGNHKRCRKTCASISRIWPLYLLSLNRSCLYQNEDLPCPINPPARSLTAIAEQHHNNPRVSSPHMAQLTQSMSNPLDTLPNEERESSRNTQQNMLTLMSSTYWSRPSTSTMELLWNTNIPAQSVLMSIC